MNQQPHIKLLLQTTSFNAAYTYVAMKGFLPPEPTTIGHNLAVPYDHGIFCSVDRLDQYEERRREFERDVQERFLYLAGGDNKHIEFLEWVWSEMTPIQRSRLRETK
ncbi:hypothetical protein QKU48_gp1002 [Fadolivirus algeromassiliense]|jgi:hypothetical protein|uniref:Uncharacterized protein n=1 Tax=Fadolivirus FV1/VV64 TaxID=3070911 RepID=A0A7D3QXG3_9VIRU|nr:hypothetical protein QKU48_gp1002 [Fadolivirus algeromassiliense]QKF94460.1 hypothetical protein Fadolivirus_1_1002 [Fadolivirus FV1/VV64]